AQSGGGPPGNAAASGGWTQEFTLSSAATIELSLRFRLIANSGFEDDEQAMALAEINGSRLGDDTDDSLATIVGNGNQGGDDDTGWQQRQFSVELGAGTHTLDLGVLVSKSTTGSEVADVYFDDVVIGVVGGGGGADGVLANDTGDLATLSSALVTQPANGVVVMASDGTFTYTPSPNFSGDDSFTYRASDSTGESSAATVTIAVSPVNDAPTGVGQDYSTAEDETLSVPTANGVLLGAGDIDTPVGQLVAVLDSDVSSGSLVLNPSGAFFYSPSPDTFGSDSFTYRVSDGVAQSPPQTVNISVTPVNDPPRAAVDVYSVDENGSLNAAVAQGNGGGGEIGIIAPGSAWRYLDDGSDQGVGWIATTFNDSSWALGIAQFGYGDGDENTVVGFGPDENDKYATTYFRRRFVVDDPGGLGGLAMRLIRDDAAAVYLNGIEVARSNLVPEASFDTRATNSTGNENAWRDFEIDPGLLVPGENLMAVEIHQHDPDSSDLSFDLSLSGTLEVVRGVLANDSDPEGTALTAAIESQPDNGSLSFEADGTFVYSPAPNFFGTDSFLYRVSDGEASS
ncbi:MAG: tandem-95 repeat protein, partial [Verrucomicrobiales bacterium]